MRNRFPISSESRRENRASDVLAQTSENVCSLTPAKRLRKRPTNVNLRNVDKTFLQRIRIRFAGLVNFLVYLAAALSTLLGLPRLTASRLTYQRPCSLEPAFQCSMSPSTPRHRCLSLSAVIVTAVSQTCSLFLPLLATCTRQTTFSVGCGRTSQHGIDTSCLPHSLEAPLAVRASVVTPPQMATSHISSYPNCLALQQSKSHSLFPQRCVPL